VVIDAVRCCKLALDRGLGGTLEGPSAYFMKSPPVQHSDERARQMVEAFIAAPGVPAPVLEGTTPTGALGDDVGVEDVSRPTV
jgi:myo-inositol-1-phosphate synthase